MCHLIPLLLDRATFLTTRAYGVMRGMGCHFDLAQLRLNQSCMAFGFDGFSLYMGVFDKLILRMTRQELVSKSEDAGCLGS